MPSAFGFGLRSLRRMVGVLVVPTLLAAFATRPASAQTPVAQFGYAESTVATGLNTPSGVAVDSAGNVYIANTGAGTVVKETSQPGGAYTVNTIATGLNSPHGVAVDGAGNVYIAVAGSGPNGGSVLKEAPSGTDSYTQSTIASGLSSPQGVAVDSAGNVYVAGPGNGVFYTGLVIKWTLSGGTYTQSTIASGLTLPYGVAVDNSGNVYVDEQENGIVIKATPSGGTYTQSTIVSGLVNPQGVAVDSAGNVYIANQGAGTVMKEIFTGGTYTQSTAATGLSSPEGLAVDAHGNFYVTDTSVNEVFKFSTQAVDFDSEAIGTPSAAHTLTSSFNSSVTLGAPVALTMGAKDQDFAIAPGGSCKVGAFFSAGDTCTVNVTFTPTVAGERKGAVELTDSTGAVIATAYVYGVGQGPQVVFSKGTSTTLGGGFSFPVSVAADGNGDVFTADETASAVDLIPQGCASASCVKPIGGGFSSPQGVAVDGAGNVYVADTGYGAVKEVPSGCLTSSCVVTLGGGFLQPSSVAVDGGGNVYVADTNVVKEIPASCIAGANDAACVKNLGGGFSVVSGVAVDAADDVYVVNAGTNAVEEIPASCIAGANDAACVKTLATGLNYPSGVAVDAADDVYLTTQNGIMLVPPGCASASCAVNIGPVATGVALDGSGNVYSSLGTTVSELNLQKVPSNVMFFGPVKVGSTGGGGVENVALQNIGNEPLTFPTPTSGNNPSIAANFSLDNATTCPMLDPTSAPGTLAPGASCTLVTDFTPTAVGSITGLLNITDNALNATAPNYATQAIQLGGTGVLTVTQLAFSAAPASTLTAGGNSATVEVAEEDSTGATVTTATDAVTLAVTGPGGYSKTYTATAVAGVATFDLSSAILKAAGSYTYTATSGSFTQAIATQTVTAAAADMLTAVSGGGQSAAINTAFPAPLTVKVADQFGNPVAGATVVFAAPTSGASATLSAPAVTAANGETSVTATANSIASTTPYTVTASVSGVSGTASFSLTNTKATATVTLGDLAETYTGSPISVTATTTPANLAVSFTYNGSATAPTNADSYAVVATITDQNYTGTATGTLTITKATTATALSTSASSITPGQSLTLTAKVADASAGSTGTPTGTVTFFDGATQLGTATLMDGVATYTDSTLASGAHSFTASYGGDVNFTPSTSMAPVSVPVEALTFSLNLTGGQGQTVVPGSPAGYTFQITPTYGAYPGVVSFSVSGLPAGATATFSPATIAANGGAQTVTMTIQTPPPATSAENHKSSPFRRGGEVALGFLLVPFLGLRKRKRWMRMLSVLLLVVGMGAITGLVSGCGSSGFFGQQQKSYQVTVTATSGTVSQSSVVTLNVE